MQINIQKFFRLLFILLLSTQAQAEDIVLTAVASNFVHVMQQLDLKNTDSANIRLSFGSSGNFSRQIIQGAPFDIFISANEEYIRQISRRDIAIAELAVFAEGQLSIYIPTNSRLFKQTSLHQLLKSVQAGEFTRLAIPNPEHAPYGIAAKQALSRAGVWAIKTDRLILAENAAQTMQYCTTNNVDACIVPSSFMYATNIDKKGKHFPIPNDWHKPIKQYIALLDDNKTSREVFQTLLSTQTKAMLTKFGYLTSE